VDSTSGYLHANLSCPEKVQLLQAGKNSFDGKKNLSCPEKVQLLINKTEIRKGVKIVSRML